MGNTDMMGMTTMLTLTSKPTKPVMDMGPTVNTVSTFPMAVPKSSPTTLPMPMEDMLLMSNTKVLLNTQKQSHTTQLSQPHTTHNCCTRIKLNVFIQNIYSINRINTEK